WIIADPYFYADPAMRYEPPHFADFPGFVPVRCQHRLFGMLSHRLLAARIVREQFKAIGYESRNIPSFAALEASAERLYLINPLLVDERELKNSEVQFVGYPHVPPTELTPLPASLHQFI